MKRCNWCFLCYPKLITIGGLELCGGCHDQFVAAAEKLKRGDNG